MEENFNKINNDTENSENIDINYTTNSEVGSKDNQTSTEYQKIEENRTLQTSIKKNENTNMEKMNFVNRVYRCISNLDHIPQNINQEIKKDIKTQYNINSITLSNTPLLLIISIIVFIFVYKTNNFLSINMYKSKSVWMLFILYLISFYASSTNFPLKMVNNYIFSIHFNQVIMFVICIVLMFNVLHGKQNNE